MVSISSFVLRLLCIVLISFSFISVSVSAEQKKVLVIESYHKEMFWDNGYRKGIINTLGPYASIDFFEMDTKRVRKTEIPARTKAAIASIYDTKPDLIILGDDNALNFVGKEALNQNIPIVFLGINGNPRDYFNGVTPKA